MKKKKKTHTHTHIDDDRILQVEAIRTLLEKCPGVLPIACGGGGVPVARVPSNPRTLVGVEAVIDKDRCGAMLANELDADGLIILTDGGGIWQNFGKPDAREMKVACYFCHLFILDLSRPPIDLFLPENDLIVARLALFFASEAGESGVPPGYQGREGLPGEHGTENTGGR